MKLTHLKNPRCPMTSIFTLTIAMALVSVSLINIFSSNGAVDFTILLIIGLMLVGLSTASLLRVSYSGLLLSSIYACIGLVLIIGSLITVPFPWILINIVFGVSLLLPIINLALFKERPTTD